MAKVAVIGAGERGLHIARWLYEHKRLGVVIEARDDQIVEARFHLVGVPTVSSLDDALATSDFQSAIVTYSDGEAALAAAAALIERDRDVIFPDDVTLDAEAFSALTHTAAERCVLMSRASLPTGAHTSTSQDSGDAQEAGKAMDSEKSAPYFAHETAVVDEPATIGEGTRIWHFSHIMAHATLGERCNLGQNVFVGGRVKLGNNVKIQNNVSVYTGVECEDDVFLGPSMVFTNVINPRSHVNRRNSYERTLLKRGSTVGANATIVCGVTLGRFAFIGAGSVVTHDVPDFGLVYGVPARLKGHICRCGVGLDFAKPVGTGPEEITCQSCGAQFAKDERGHVTLLTEDAAEA